MRRGPWSPEQLNDSPTATRLQELLWELRETAALAAENGSDMSEEHRRVARIANEQLGRALGGDPDVIGRTPNGPMSWLPPRAQEIASRHLGVSVDDPLSRRMNEAAQALK